MREAALRRIPSLLACALFAACGSDRTAGGTTGTEAGNALAVILTLPDGAPAARAGVVARPSDAIDSRDSAGWRRGEADAAGSVVLRLPDGDWTLEARSEGYVAVSYLAIRGDSTLRDTLVPGRTLRGTVLGSSSGTVSLPGLSLSTTLSADGNFRFDSLPAQPLRLLVDGVSRSAPSDTGAFVVSARDSALLCLDPVTLPVQEGAGLAGLRRLPDSLVPDSGALLLDPQGGILRLERGGVTSSGMRRVWSRVPAGVGSVILCRGVSGGSKAESVFRVGDGLRLALVPDLDSSLGDLARSGGVFASSGSVVVDTAWGRSLDAPLGGSIGEVRSGLPDTGAFAISVHSRLLSTGIESLWMLDWSDSSGRGLRVGVGGRRLTLVLPGIDTGIVWDPGTSWFQLAIGWDGSALTVAIDGTERLRVPTTAPVTRSAWTRRRIGFGGGLRLGALLVRTGAFAPEAQSVPPIDWERE